jgi:acetyl esterase/lipase
MFSLLAYSLLFLAGPRVEADVVYAKTAGVELKMDIYHPQPAPAKPAGAVLCQEIAKRGMVAATVQYRLAPAHKWPAMLEDVRAAARFLRANAAKYNVDPNRLAAAGASAGGHLSLMLGFTDSDSKAEPFPGVSSRVNAVLNIFGPTDLNNDFSPGFGILFQSVTGKPLSEAGPLLTAASPITHIDKRSAAVFTVHGTLDPLVPVKQSQRLDEALKKAGIHHELRVVEGMKHEVSKAHAGCVKALTEGLEWLAQTLSPIG